MRLPFVRRSSPLFAVLVLVLTLVAWPAAEAQAQESSGSITGRVLNAGTGEFLQSVLVVVEGTQRSATTNREGRFTIQGVPAGSYEVTARYMGLTAETTQVTVVAGERARVDFSLTSAIYEVDGLTVTGLREGQAAALSIQQQALNIKNVISSQAFGNVTDGNVGELLKRVPGVSYELGNGDVRYVSVRGISPALNTVTVDGNRMPQAYGQSNRAFNIDQVGINYIETLEVVKAPTPDMEADFVGGAVNLVPKNAFNLNRRELSYSVGANMNPLRSNDTRPSFSAGYSDVFGSEGNLGVLFTGNFTQKFVPVDGVIQRWERSQNQPAYMEHARFNEESKERIRYSLGMRSDYRLDDDNQFYVNLMYNTYVDQQFRREFRLDTGRNDSRYSEVSPNVVETTATEVRMWHQFREVESNTWTIQTGGEHTPGAWEIDYGVHYAHSASEYTTSPGGETEFRTNRETRWRIDYNERDDRGFPVITQLDDLDIYDFNNYRIQQFQERHQNDTDQMWGGEANVLRHFDVGIPLSIKAGTRYRSQDRDLNRSRRNYSVNTDGMDLNQFQWQGAPSSWLDGRYATPPVLDLMTMYDLFRSNPELFEENEGEFIRRSFEPGGNFEVSESILGGYLMGTAQVGDLSVIGGVRLERTSVMGEGINQDVTMDREDPDAYSFERREG
ncbi:MAG: TonB-dependent receptor, partial [Gemmatimonadales bacterium]